MSNWNIAVSVAAVHITGMSLGATIYGKYAHQGDGVLLGMFVLIGAAVFVLSAAALFAMDRAWSEGAAKRRGAYLRYVVEATSADGVRRYFILDLPSLEGLSDAEKFSIAMAQLKGQL